VNTSEGLYRERANRSMRVKSSVVSYWCTFGYVEINRLLRTGTVSDKNLEDINFIQEDADHLIAAASKPFRGQVFRGLALSSIPTPGDSFSDGGLQSFSKKKDAAIAFAQKRVHERGGIPIVLILDASQGFDIEEWALSEGLSDGSESSNREVLIAPGSFVAQRIFQVDGVYFVEIAHA
jgi:hypothetical protein